MASAEIVKFAKRYDPHRFHVDVDRAAAGRWNGLIASDWLTRGIAMELAVAAALTGSESNESLRINELRLRIEVLESRQSSSGRTGIVRWQRRLLNQSDRPDVEMIVTGLFDFAQMEADSR